VKTGKLHFVNDVQPALEEVMAKVEALAEKSNLPAQVDRNYWDNWLLNIYERYL
jgi:hypothetical protein